MPSRRRSGKYRRRSRKSHRRSRGSRRSSKRRSSKRTRGTRTRMARYRSSQDSFYEGHTVEIISRNQDGTVVIRRKDRVPFGDGSNEKVVNGSLLLPSTSEVSSFPNVGEEDPSSHTSPSREPAAGHPATPLGTFGPTSMHVDDLLSSQSEPISTAASKGSLEGDDDSSSGEGSPVVAPSLRRRAYPGPSLPSNLITLPPSISSESTRVDGPSGVDESARVDESTRVDRPDSKRQRR